VSDDRAERLREAPFEVVGRFADASNATLLVRLLDRDPRPLDELAAGLGRPPTVADLEVEDLAVHKPQRGEAPLWDFPPGTLHLREVAAYEVSAALGWDLVPCTVLRASGPFGPGSLQRFVAHDPEQHYFTLVEADDPELHDQLVAMVLLDLVIDNADRKGGHVLLEPGSELQRGHLRLVDHGVTFNVVRKLRTVAWDFAGRPVPEVRRGDLLGLLASLDGALGARLAPLLSPEELEVLRDRVAATAALTTLPEPSGRYPYPWPLL
jgi:uncharacterized repeat protein (TIGR03843 family)